LRNKKGGGGKKKKWFIERTKIVDPSKARAGVAAGKQRIAK